MSILTSDEITPHIAAGVLNFFISEGYPFGDFGQQLLKAITVADSQHTAVMATAFPGLVAAVLLYRNDPDGTESLRQIAGFPTAYDPRDI